MVYLRYVSRVRRVAGIATALTFAVAGGAFASTPRFEVTIAPGAHSGPLTGRLVVVVAKAAQAGNQPEPRLQINPRGPAMFAIDLERLAPGATAVVDGKSLGFPFQLVELPPGDYVAQLKVTDPSGASDA